MCLAHQKQLLQMQMPNFANNKLSCDSAGIEFTTLGKEKYRLGVDRNAALVETFRSS